jgi:hypothetical protein
MGLFGLGKNKDDGKSKGGKKAASEGSQLWDGVVKACLKQQWAEGLKLLDRLKVIEPENSQVHMKLGDLLQRTGKKAEAIAAYELASDLMINEGGGQKALAVFKIILRLDPENEKATTRSKEILAEMEAAMAPKAAPPPPVDDSAMGLDIEGEISYESLGGDMDYDETPETGGVAPETVPEPSGASMESLTEGWGSAPAPAADAESSDAPAAADDWDATPAPAASTAAPADDWDATPAPAADAPAAADDWSDSGAPETAPADAMDDLHGINMLEALSAPEPEPEPAPKPTAAAAPKPAPKPVAPPKPAAAPAPKPAPQPITPPKPEPVPAAAVAPEPVAEEEESFSLDISDLGLDDSDGPGERNIPLDQLHPIFAYLSEEYKELLPKKATHLKFDDGQVILNEAEEGDSMYIITSGKAKVISVMFGKTLELAMLKQGDFFGEIAFLTGRPRTASVIAIGHTEVMELGRQLMQEVVMVNPMVLDSLTEFYQERVQQTVSKVKGGG